MDIIKENRIQLVPLLQHWSVVGSSGDIYVVKLFKGGVRNQTCTCAASAICCHILAAMYSIDCEMLSKKKGNITVTQRKGRKQQRYRRSGKKPLSKLEKKDSKAKAKVSKKKKPKTSVAEMLNSTPQSPDTSDFNDNLSDVPKKSKKFESENFVQDHPKLSPSSKAGFSDRFSAQPTSSLSLQGGLFPSACSPLQSWAPIESQLLEQDGSLARACSQQSTISNVSSRKLSSAVASPQTDESPKSPSSSTSSKSSGAEKKYKKQLDLSPTRHPHVCKKEICMNNLK
jgi:hypothetical protein